MNAIKLDKSLQIELAILGSALFALGVFVALQSASAGSQAAPLSTASTFSERDFAVFDRGFRLGDSDCDVGLKSHRICFGTSPHEMRLMIGETLPLDLPVLPAEFPIIVMTDLKDEGLQTVRFGCTIALIERDSRRIMDVLHLTAPDYTSARDVPVTTAS
jgi:hypothetical protein